MDTTLFHESVLVGISTAVIGQLVRMGIRQMNVPINRTYKSLLALFITGAAIHLTFEQLGINKAYCDTHNKDPRKDTLKSLTRQISRWALAAKQDENPMIRLLHANYSTGYLWALQSIATNKQVYEATGVDMRLLIKEVVAQQDKATKIMADKCPNITPPDGFLSQIAGHT